MPAWYTFTTDPPVFRYSDSIGTAVASAALSAAGMALQAAKLAGDSGAIAAAQAVFNAALAVVTQQKLCGRSESAAWMATFLPQLIAAYTTNALIADAAGLKNPGAPVSVIAPFYATDITTGLSQLSITASGSPQLFSSARWGGFHVGDKLSIGVGTDQEFVAVTAVVQADENHVPPIIGTFTAVFTKNHAAPVGITPALVYGSSTNLAVDDRWSFGSDALYGPLIGTQPLGDMFRICAQKYTRLLPYYQDVATDLQSQATAGGGCP